MSKRWRITGSVDARSCSTQVWSGPFSIGSPTIWSVTQPTAGSIVYACSSGYPVAYCNTSEGITILAVGSGANNSTLRWNTFTATDITPPVVAPNTGYDPIRGSCLLTSRPTPIYPFSVYGGELPALDACVFGLTGGSLLDPNLGYDCVNGSCLTNKIDGGAYKNSAYGSDSSALEACLLACGSPCSGYCLPESQLREWQEAIENANITLVGES